MRAAVLTREYPPEVYGGAGVHVEYLVRDLRALIDVDVHCFGAPRPDAATYQPDNALAEANAALQTVSVDVQMAAATGSADLVHSHTWYANMAGHLSALLHGVPHVVTTHSLEPHRPWKAEQLGGGYAISSWAERTAYESADAIIAVSEGTRRDILDVYPAVDPARVHVVHNGIDTTEYAPDAGTDVLLRHGVDLARPYVVFVGRITRQKGVEHLVAAAHRLHPDIQVVLCAGAPDTVEIGERTAAAVHALAAARAGVVWISQMLPRPDVVQLLTHAAAFVCPSVYEPLGIVNLEAMACGTAVVASAVGGIPEVVVDGETGLLVPYSPAAPGELEAGLAEAINAVVGDPARAQAMGEAGRRRAVQAFGWRAIAERTVDVYRSVLQ